MDEITISCPFLHSVVSFPYGLEYAIQCKSYIPGADFVGRSYRSKSAMRDHLKTVCAVKPWCRYAQMLLDRPDDEGGSVT